MVDRRDRPGQGSLDHFKAMTSWGATRGDVAWEHRVTAVRDRDVSGTLPQLDSCPLTAYAGRLGAETAGLHREVHTLAVTRRGGPEHRGDWERLAALVAGEPCVGRCGRLGAGPPLFQDDLWRLVMLALMRILVAGATGYVGSRLVPELLRRGHEVVAAASSPPRPERFAWGASVELVRMDAIDAEQVRRATAGVDAVCYLVHGLSRRGFRGRDRVAAEHVRDAVDEHGVGRVVYLSGLVPDVPEDRLSPHIASRLEVERILRESAAATLSLRAGVIIGAGSTSFEIVRQTASTLLVQPVPLWMRSRVQPIGVSDVLRALADALEGDAAGDADIGGPDVVTYPGLLAMYAEAARLPRVQVPVLAAPVTAVSLTAGLVSAAPYWTTAALVRSLRHDMVCRSGQPDPAVVDLRDALPLAEALRQAVLADGPGGRPSGRETSDPSWVRDSWVERSLAATRLPGSTLLSSALHVADHRVRGLLSLLR